MRSQLFPADCALFVAAALPGSSHAANSLSRSDLQVENNPISVAAADLNRDGILDLAATGCNDPSADGPVSVLLGNGDGTFSRSNAPASVAVADGAHICFDVVSSDPDGDRIAMLHGERRATWQLLRPHAQPRYQARDYRDPAYFKLKMFQRCALTDKM